MENSKPIACIDEIIGFRQLSEINRSLLAEGLHYARFTKKTIVLKKGQCVSGAYVVIRGKLRVFSLSADGNEATLYQINSGETCILALNCIFNDLLYPAWVEAGVATEVAIIPGALFKALFDSEAAVRNMTVHALSSLVFGLMSGLEKVYSSKLDQRVADFLLMNASMDGKIRMTQQEIASHLGSTREVIARVMAKLASQGHIQTARNLIVINDPPNLVESVILGNKTKSREGRKSKKVF